MKVAARRVSADHASAGSVAAGCAGQRALPLDLVARPYGQLLARLHLDSRIHRSGNCFGVSAPPSGCHGGGRRGGRADGERATGHQCDRYRAPASGHACPERADHRPSRQRSLRSRPWQRRDREHGALRVRLHQTGEPIRRGVEGHPAALGQRRPGRFRRAVLSPAPCPPRHRAVSRCEPADLDRRKRAANTRDRRTLRGRVVAHRRVESRRLRPEAGRRKGFGRTGRARSHGHHALLYPGVPDRPR